MPDTAACICAVLLPIGGEPKPCPVHGWTGCIRCGGTEDLMDRGMAPGMTYCAPCRKAMRGVAASETVEGSRCANTPTPIRPPVKEANGHG